MPNRCGCDDGCVPTTCAAAAAQCGAIPDGCGGILQCGTCSGGKVCGANCTPNVCDFPSDAGGGCPCDPMTCVQKGVSCGATSDGCGGILQCGACPSPLVCGGGGTPGVCGCAGTCTPIT
jgi:hypothetical protein